MTGDRSTGNRSTGNRSTGNRSTGNRSTGNRSTWDRPAAEGDLRGAKAALRAQALARRDALVAEARQAAAETLGARPFPLPVSPGVCICGYAPIRSELSPLPLMRRLEAGGARLALPVMAGRHRPLDLRAWRFGDPLRAGVWNIREPVAGAAVDPDILLVPLAAFDRRGGRLGYGGGYYDRTLAALRALRAVVAVGLGFAMQEVDGVPMTAGDARLDLELTESEIIDCRGA